MSSTYQLKELLKTETEVLRKLKEYASNSKYQDKVIEDFIEKNYKNEDFTDLISDNDFEAYVSHPINAFGIIQRTIEANIQVLLQNSSVNSMNESILKSIKYFPLNEEYATACSSIALIQESYNLKTEDISQGKIYFNGELLQAKYKLRPYDKVSIGNSAGKKGYADNAIEWAREV